MAFWATIPSHLVSRRNPPKGRGFTDTLLRTGEVIEVTPPTSKNNLSQKVTEYKVRVQNTSNGTGTPKDYDHCVLASSFGGLADKTTWTLRAGTIDNKKGFGQGSKVLILCINGESNNAVIIGGVRDTEDKADEDNGQSLFGIFNGIEWKIDDEGQLIVTYTGKTFSDGKRSSSVKSTQVGTFLSFTKSGGLLLADKDAKNKILLDHENGKVIIARDKGFEIGRATDKMILGSSFRDAQKSLHDDLKQHANVLKNLLQNAGQSLLTASVKNAVPITGGAAAASDFAQAGTLLISASVVAGQINQAIQAFESKASAKHSFLSDLDKLG